MILTPEKSICEEKQSIVVSRDKGTKREHRATNPDKQFILRHYKLDGVIFKQQKTCDFLLVNDTTKKAYFIELKGENIDEAVKQLEVSENNCKEDLEGYSFLYRIVCSKAKTHKIRNNKFRKFKDKCGPRLVMKENKLEEILD